MRLVDEICIIIRDVLLLEDQGDNLDAGTQLLGAIPEFDSMAVVSVVTALEEEFGCEFDDDEINAEVFQTIGTLSELVEQKLA